MGLYRPRTPSSPQTPDRNGVGISRLVSAPPPFRKILPTPLPFRVLSSTIWSFQVLIRVPYFWQSGAPKKAPWSTFFLRVWMPLQDHVPGCSYCSNNMQHWACLIFDLVLVTYLVFGSWPHKIQPNTVRTAHLEHENTKPFREGSKNLPEYFDETP